MRTIIAILALWLGQSIQALAQVTECDIFGKDGLYDYHGEQLAQWNYQLFNNF